jgi:hypothetical protein
VSENQTSFSVPDAQENQILQKLREELAAVTGYRYMGPPVQVNFPLKTTVYEVQHLLGEVPDGCEVITADCLLKRAPGRQWTKELAYLVSDSDNSYAVLKFGVLREGVTLVQAS